MGKEAVEEGVCVRAWTLMYNFHDTSCSLHWVFPTFLNYNFCFFDGGVCDTKRSFEK